MLEEYDGKGLDFEPLIPDASSTGIQHGYLSTDYIAWEPVSW